MWSIVHDAPVPLKCEHCNGAGIVCRSPTYGVGCMECGAMGYHYFDRSALTTLAHNLAIAAALCRAFRLGAWHGGEDVYLIGDEEPQTWFPNCGRTAP